MVGFASHWARGSAGLKMPIFTATFSVATLTSKVGQVDLVSGARSEFISRCVNARLQVSVCSGHGARDACFLSW